jgi:hypothetical protein
MSAPQRFTIPAMVVELGGQEPQVILKPPAPLPPFRVPCKRETIVALAPHLYRWIDVTVDGGKLAAFAPRPEAP